jgi:hypothetical protein
MKPGPSDDYLALLRGEITSAEYVGPEEGGYAEVLRQALDQLASDHPSLFLQRQRAEALDSVLGYCPHLVTAGRKSW